MEDIEVDIKSWNTSSNKLLSVEQYKASTINQRKKYEYFLTLKKKKKTNIPLINI